jgi:hypothetical protein
LPPAPDRAREAEHRDQLASHLTVIRAQTQLLQRRIARMDGLAPHDRARLDVGLAAIFASSGAISSRLAHLPPASASA